MNKSNQIKITALYCRRSQDNGGQGIQQHSKPDRN